ncbi:hypothetical protein V5O48_010735 [Marasmius crinis-equi]|uniref:Alpha/beta-hydrolase n=1 Tax=Marasmius crinis-equi TaxID=585013 RepID=A0ABR3F7I5_9AGAR
MEVPEPLTLVYKTCDGGPIKMDVYLPKNVNPSSGIVVYFHGGGLVVGNRKSWFPTWLQKRLDKAGHLLVCPDYRLIPCGGVTGHDILQDILDAFAFIRGPEFERALPTEGTFKVRPDRVAVAGTSSGGTCTYLAATHVQPRPRAAFSMYGMGGDFLTPYYYTPKTKPFFRGRELLDPEKFTEYLHPSIPLDPSQSISESLLEYHPDTSPTPGYPANPHMLLTRLYIQLGSFLDYYTGQHSPSLSASLRENTATTSTGDTETKKRLAEGIDDRHLDLFPSLSADSSWPPTLFVHGSEDTAVPVGESRYLHELLLKEGVPSELVVVEGKEHSFDYDPDAETHHHDLFDRVASFLDEHLK